MHCKYQTLFQKQKAHTTKHHPLLLLPGGMGEFRYVHTNIFNFSKWKTLILSTYNLNTQTHTHKASLYAGNFPKKGYIFTNGPSGQFTSRKQVRSECKKPLKLNLTPQLTLRNCLNSFSGLGQLVNSSTNRRIPWY